MDCGVEAILEGSQQQERYTDEGGYGVQQDRFHTKETARWVYGLGAVLEKNMGAASKVPGALREASERTTSRPPSFPPCTLVGASARQRGQQDLPTLFSRQPSASSLWATKLSEFLDFVSWRYRDVEHASIAMGAGRNKEPWVVVVEGRQEIPLKHWETFLLDRAKVLFSIWHSNNVTECLCRNHRQRSSTSLGGS